MGLGALKDVTLAEARRKLAEFDAQRAAGDDPLALKRAAKIVAAGAARAEALTADRWDFARATKEYLEAHGPSWKHPRARQVWLGPIVKYAYPILGRMKLDDIGVEHVAAVMTAAEAGGAPQVAPRIRLRIEQILNAATVLGKRDAGRQNPASIRLIKAVRPMKREDQRENFRRIALDDAPATFRKVRARAASSTALSALVFTIATAARPGEALGAKRGEIDLNKKLWTVPAARMKGGREHIVPLSNVALAVLERQASVCAEGAVFAGAGGSPMSYGVFAAAVRRLEFDVGTPHSWRSIFADAAADRLGVARETREACLAHSLGAVEGAYRRETGVPARAVAMQKYADWLLGEGPDVIAFPDRETG
jgi:integrase